MVGMKGYKVTDSSRSRMFGVACDSLRQLRSKGSTRLGLNGDVYLALDDGTIIDDEDYFALIPPQTVIVFYRKTEAVVTGADFILNILRRVNAGYLTAGEKAGEFLSGKAEDLVKFLREDGKSGGKSNREDDPGWFSDLETNATTKEEYMFRKSQDRIKGYFYKFLSDARKNSVYTHNPKSRKELDGCIRYFKNKLQEDFYFGCFFDRRCAKASDEVDKPRLKPKRWRGEDEVPNGLPKYDRLSYCDSEGRFVCQGRWDTSECEFGFRHSINPYLDRESRILFSTWNFDHRIEKSRTVLPTLFEVVQNRRIGQEVNYDYFYRLLFTNVNLKSDVLVIVTIPNSVHAPSRLEFGSEENNESGS
ncbi:UNVERIFIED_CONTAM: hypothetical protein PYX00_004989 [Menopon gallinae]|uniref:CIDE-N domain-containing protein n=1 Tax=Menopon gallinae TaxID=328185 RepID=A0AAW2I7P9_9NEOP